MLQLSQVGVEGRLAPFSAQVDAGLQFHLIGPNGAGKSTLLARLAGILPGTGEILLAGQPLGGIRAMNWRCAVPISASNSRRWR